MPTVLHTELFLFSEPASISKGLQDETVAVGTTVLLQCTAHGIPPPALSWLHNAAPLHPSPRHFLLGSSLQIRGVTMQDSGVYQCIADNGVGFAQSAGRLRVQPGRSTAGPQESKVSIYKNCGITEIGRELPGAQSNLTPPCHALSAASPPGMPPGWRLEALCHVFPSVIFVSAASDHRLQHTVQISAVRCTVRAAGASEALWLLHI